MKKSIKVCLISGIACLVLGVSMATTAVVMGADPLWGNDFSFGGWEEPAVWSGKDEFDNVTTLKADLAAGAIRYEEGGVDKVTVRIEKAEHFTCKVEGDTLKIDSRKVRNNKSNGHLLIQVPEGFNWDELHIDLSAGSFYADTLSAGKTDLEVKAGSMEIDDGRFASLKMENAAGSIECNAEVTGDVDMDNDAGKINLWLTGSEEDYDLKVECKVGSVRVGESYVAGVQVEKKMERGVGRKLKVDCNAGAVNVAFGQ